MSSRKPNHRRRVQTRSRRAWPHGRLTVHMGDRSYSIGFLSVREAARWAHLQSMELHMSLESR